MMFDPPDYPYMELSETYDDLLLNKNCTNTTGVENINLEVSTDTACYETNNYGQYFPENSFLANNSANQQDTVTDLYDKPDTLLNDEPTLLDENIVNQFLLPLQGSIQNNEQNENTGPDLLSLHSCVICHDIFTTESELLSHTVEFHASLNITLNEADTFEQAQNHIVEGATNNTSAFEADWLVCQICQRVLSTAIEVEPKEYLCCVDTEGKCRVTNRLLHTMFVCDACSGLFADGDALDRHKANCFVNDENVCQNTENINPTAISSEVYFTCDLCSKQFASKEDLENHLVACQKPTRNSRRNRNYTGVTNNKMWNCGSCNQLFVSARELYRHKRGEDRPEGSPLTAYICQECDKVLGSMCALHTHLKMHKVSKPGYPCRICGRRFNQSGHLAIHMRMHTGERPYPCDLCPKAFKVKVERDDHRRTHTGERPFACPECPKTFTAAARLREHARIHTDQRPYRCDICGAAFRRPYARTVHTLIHTGEKPHECDVCGTAFRRSGDMWKHKRTLHGV